MNTRNQQLNRPGKGRYFRTVNHRSTLAILLLSLFLVSCADVTQRTGTPSALDARGPAAAHIGVLWWVMLGLGTLVFLAVLALLIMVITRRKQPGTELGKMDIVRDAPDAHQWIWWGGIIMPAVILAVVLFFTLYTLSAVATPPEETEHHYEIIGRMWWWEVRNANMGIATANELYVPVGEPVRLTITSADVIHSFWIPQLQGKMDAIPGRANEFWIQADEPGVYRGICTEFCGVQHANMQFILVAVSPEAYETWVGRESSPAAEPQDELAVRGQEVFMTTQCQFCHQIRGTDATGQVGPDLTHFGSRLTLGAGIRENNRGNLGGWVADPQHIKPGNIMPKIQLESEDLQAILAYLESLE